MLEILNSCWTMVIDLVSLLWGIVLVLGLWAWDVLYHLHVSAPRLEGLLVGVSLAWLMMRRDKHPLLRVLSAPLKLIVDVLDLAWDQVVEVTGDLWGTASGWVVNSVKWGWGKVVAVYNTGLGMLKSLRDKLSRKKD
jgi:hypothetical protein